MSKKQGTIALCVAKAKFTSAAHCYEQVLWMKNQLKDYNVH